MDYSEFSQLIQECTKCSLHKYRINAVVGEGDLNARIMIVGEAPGENEDIHNRPFIGRSGKLLRKILVDVGFSISDIYITNIVKCRPPENRDPFGTERNTCGAYLLEQIKTYIKPEVIIGVGRISSEIIKSGYVQKNDHGKIFEFKNYKFMGVYHPAAALRNSEWKQYLIDDLTNLRKYLGIEPKKYQFWE